MKPALSAKALAFFFLLGLCFTSQTKAQESISSNAIEPPLRQNSQEFIQLELDTHASTEAMRLFLKEYKLDLKQSNIDLSDALKDLRQAFKTIRQEHRQSLEAARRAPPPRLVKLRKTKKPAAAASAVPDPYELFLDIQFPPADAMRTKENPLSIEERQRLADAEEKRLEQIRLEQLSEKGQLKLQIEQEPLKTQQAQLTRFSDKIKELLKQLKTGRTGTRSLFLELGNVYLESQRYLNAMNVENKRTLIRYATYSNTTLGSYETALWAFKMALDANPNDGEANMLIAETYLETGEKALALQRARNAERWFARNQQTDKADQTRNYIETLLSSPQPASPR